MKTEELENLFTHHPPKDEGQIARYIGIRKAGFALALEINESAPDCADKMAAIRKVREAVMTANAAIACNE